MRGILTISLLAATTTASFAQPAQDARIEPEFEWHRQRRYGMMSEPDAITILPNTFDYVHNKGNCPCVGDNCEEKGPQFKLILDPSNTHFPPGVPGQVDLNRRPPPAAEELIRPRPSQPAGPDARRSPNPQDILDRLSPTGDGNEYPKLSWTIRASRSADPIPARVQAVSPFHHEVCLPEGKYDVELRAETERGWNTVSRPVEVKDRLIVVLGDSFAAGQGVPEKIVTETVEKVIRLPPPASGTQKIKVTEHRTLWASDGENTGRKGPKGKTIPDMSKFTDVHRDHYRANRSSFAAGSQLALQLEDDATGKDAIVKASVTFVNLAMTGATTDKGVLGPYAGGRPYGDDDGMFRMPKEMEAQLTTLKRLVGKRKIDALIMSIGGNDAGFGNAAKALVVREPTGVESVLVPLAAMAQGAEPSLEDIGKAVHSGRWTGLKNSHLMTWPGIFGDFENKLGMDALPGQYDAIKRRLVGDGINVQHVYILGYPNFVTKRAEGGSGGGGKPPGHSPPIHLRSLEQPPSWTYCKSILDKLGKRLWEIGPAEVKWAVSDVLVPLNGVIREAAARNGWTYVDVSDVALAHGVCSPAPYKASAYNPVHPVKAENLERNIRWFRAAEEAGNIYHEKPIDTLGTIHPNEFGYRAIADRLRRRIMETDPGF